MWEIPCCVLFLTIFTHWILPLQEARNDLQSFRDPILCRLPNFDTSQLVGTLSIFLPCQLILDTWMYDDYCRLQQAIITYTCILATKCVTMYVTPFDKPSGYIPLMDLISRATTTTTKGYIGRDLMFSGHTSMALICVIATRHLLLKYVATCCTFLMVACLLINRVHYTIDVIVALFVTYTWSTFLGLQTTS